MTSPVKTYKFCRVVFLICFIISALLLILGFVLPPTGVIDKSVLTAVGELLVFPTIVYGVRAIEFGLEIHFRKGDYSIDIERDDNLPSKQK